MAELIQKQDTLNEGRVKINAAITDAEQAKITADGADSKATQALANSESTQTQLDTIVINGDSSVEAAQARVDEKGVGHTTLKDRIDDGFTKVTSQLNDKANEDEFVKNKSTFQRRRYTDRDSYTVDDFSEGLDLWTYREGVGVNAEGELTMLSENNLINLVTSAFYSQKNARSIEVTLGGEVNPNYVRIAFGVDKYNFFFIAKANDNLDLYRVVNGEFDINGPGHSLGRLSGVAPNNYAAGDRIKVEVFNQYIQYYHNGVLLGTFTLDLNKGLNSPMNEPLMAGVSWINHSLNYSIEKVKIKFNSSNKYAHLGRDDAIKELKDLTLNQNNYSSIFEHPTFAFLKRMKDIYHIAFTFNLYYEDSEGWNISNMTDKYKEEFLLNSDWLKFSFHGFNSSSRYNGVIVNTSDAKTHYENTVNQIIRFAGFDSVDRVIRSHFFSGTKDIVNAWKSLGVKGILSARIDDNAPENYYLNDRQKEALKYCDYFLDESNGMYFIKTDILTDDTPPLSTLNNRIKDKNFLGQMDILEIFTHDDLSLLPVQNEWEEMIAWIVNNGYDFDFSMNRF